MFSILTDFNTLSINVDGRCALRTEKSRGEGNSAAFELSVTAEVARASRP